MRSFAASPSFDELLHQLAYGETQQGAPPNSIKSPLVIRWGRSDRVCFPSQAQRAMELFPDVPQETVRLILAATNGNDVAGAISADAA